MLELGFEVKEIVEGRARLLVPKGVGEVDPSKLPAFYNPASKISRDIAVLVTYAYFSGGDKTFAEPLAGLGARSVRLLLESGAFAEGKACDINENSARLISVNAQLNGLEGRLKAYHMDANVFLSTIAAERQKVHYVDLDPSGSPVRFLEGSLRALLPDGLLGVSATDLAALSGASPRTALWRYGLRLTRTVFRKEVALRALTAVAVMAASRLSRSAVPVFAVIHRHFARVFLKVRRGKMGAYRSVSQLGYLKYCHSCLNVERVGGAAGNIGEVRSLRFSGLPARAPVAGPPPGPRDRLQGPQVRSDRRGDLRGGEEGAGPHLPRAQRRPLQLSGLGALEEGQVLTGQPEGHRREVEGDGLQGLGCPLRPRSGQDGRAAGPALRTRQVDGLKTNLPRALPSLNELKAAS
jgi:tRNA G26 N,N-dimethylase Trm1